MELEDVTVADDRVAGVVSTLKADHDVGPLREQVGDLPFSLIAPLGADYDYSGHDQGIMRNLRPRAALVALVIERAQPGAAHRAATGRAVAE